MTHWKTQFNYDYLGAYSLPDGKDIVLTIRETKREQVVGASGKKEECFVAYLFLRKCETDDPQPDELQNYDEDFQNTEFRRMDKQANSDWRGDGRRFRRKG